MGHDPDPAAEADRLRGLIRDAHAAVKDLRAAVRETEQLRGQLVDRFETAANEAIAELSNFLQAEANRLTAQLNAEVRAVRDDIAKRLLDARIVHDPQADNFVIVFSGAKYVEDEPMPYPERMTPQ